MLQQVLNFKVLGHARTFLHSTKTRVQSQSRLGWVLLAASAMDLPDSTSQPEVQGHNRRV